MLFRNIVFSALLVGVFSGIVLTAVQFLQVIPIILSAERFEAKPVAVSTAVTAPVDHKRLEPITESVWGPENGIERTSYTLLTNILTAVGFSLLVLVAIVALQRPDSKAKLNWRHGLFWGASGYVIFFVAPALGIPPEIPGATAAPLESRQEWWFLAVICTAAGLGGAVFLKKNWRWALLGFLIVPHLFGAPHITTGMFEGQPPAAAAELAGLAQQFIIATAITSATLWLTLGITSVWTVRRFVLT